MGCTGAGHRIILTRQRRDLRGMGRVAHPLRHAKGGAFDSAVACAVISAYRQRQKQIQKQRQKPLQRPHPSQTPTAQRVGHPGLHTPQPASRKLLHRYSLPTHPSGIISSCQSSNSIERVRHPSRLICPDTHMHVQFVGQSSPPHEA
jgi:hypothetical protein